MLLDGHLVLRSGTSCLIRLGTDVFSRLHLSGLILLCDDAGVAAAGLVSRDGVSTNSETVAELAVEEATHALAVCCALGIPLIVIDSPTETQLINAVVQLLADAPV